MEENNPQFNNDNNRNQNIVENNNIESNNDRNILPPPKKNRTLQYYKFLFYSMKLEIKNTELMNLIRSSNIYEILLWILSLIFFNEFNKVYIIIHSLHFIRGILGIFILVKLPQSYNIVEGMEAEYNRSDLENKIFNDYARKVLNKEIFEKAKSQKTLTMIYLIITMLNIFIDLKKHDDSIVGF